MKLTAFKKNKTKTDKLKLIIFPLVVLGLVIALTFFILRSARQPLAQEFEPAQTINIEESFSGQLHFNDVLGKNDFSELIVAAIEKAEERIELAMYSMDSEEIRNALIDAAERGVFVDLAFNDKHQESLTYFFSKKPDNLEIKFSGRSDDKAYMHHKFLIIDRGYSGQKLFFGSYNFTDIQGKFDPSFILETDREELVDVFGEEFLRIKSDNLWQEKRSDSYNPFVVLINYPEGYIEVWFAPSSKVNNLKSKMQELIRQANKKIEVMIWQLTNRDIAASFLEASKKIKTTIITDDANFYSPDSILPAMTAQKNRQKLNKLLIIDDSKRNDEVKRFNIGWELNSFLHQHLLLIDDNLALFGTNNWSNGGFWGNDESIMISNIPEIVTRFKQSFDYNFQVNY